MEKTPVMIKRIAFGVFFRFVNRTCKAAFPYSEQLSSSVRKALRPFPVSIFPSRVDWPIFLFLFFGVHETDTQKRREEFLLMTRVLCSAQDRCRQ